MFGINVFALRLPSVIFSTVGIILTHLIAKKLFGDRWVAFVAAFLFAIHGLILELVGGRVSTDHVDIIFLFFVQLTIFLTVYPERAWPSTLAVGFALGCAILTKSWPALVVVPVWWVWWYRRLLVKEQLLHFSSLAFMVVMIVLPWNLHIGHAFPLESAWEAERQTAHLTEVIEGHSGGVLFHINRIRIIYGELVYLPLIMLLLAVLKKGDFAVPRLCS